MDYKDRKDRLSRISNGRELKVDFPLLKAFPIPPHHFDRLINSVTHFLFDSIVANNPDFKGKISSEFFEKHTGDVEALPNITPSGVILPKRQNYISYNLVHMAVASIFQGLKIGEFVDKIHVPVNIRFVQGTESDDLKNRPRYTGKIHSDIWAGEPAHAIMIFIPLLGDLTQTGVEFFEPREFSSDYMRPLNDFNEGAHLADDAEEYPFKFTPESLVITDSVLLHRTMRTGGRPRLSIDFRFLSRDILASDYYLDTPRMANYISPDKWASIGTDQVVVSRNDLDFFKSENDLKDSYPTSVELLKI